MQKTLVSFKFNALNIYSFQTTNYDSILQTAQSIAKQAHDLAYDPNYMSPFAQFACDNGLNVRGKHTVLLCCLLKTPGFYCACDLNIKLKFVLIEAGAFELFFLLFFFFFFITIINFNHSWFGGAYIRSGYIILKCITDHINVVFLRVNYFILHTLLPCPAGGKPDDITVLLSIVAEYTD